jgi:hypothetical protein
MSAPDLVVGEVGFGANFGSSAELDFYRAEDRRNLAEVANLQAEKRELIKRVNRLKLILSRCAALSPDVSDEKHEALLAVEEPL